jgi:6-phosphofructokinase 1
VEVFYYEDHQRADEGFIETYDRALRTSAGAVVFLSGAHVASAHVKSEIATINQRCIDDSDFGAVVVIVERECAPERMWEVPSELARRPWLTDHFDRDGEPIPLVCAYRLARALGLTWRFDLLPVNPHLFSYEKDIIEFYRRLEDLGDKVFAAAEEEAEDERRESDRRRLRDGAPLRWPTVKRLPSEVANVLEDIGHFRPPDSSVAAAALTALASPTMTFPEAGPRATLRWSASERLRVGVVVSGGIAPGINAVIDGIVQRHHQYHEKGRLLEVYGFLDGFSSMANLHAPHPYVRLVPVAAATGANAGVLATAPLAAEGGSIIGTSRLEGLVDPRTRAKLLGALVSRLSAFDILYVIGGDGSMKAAHAIYNAGENDGGRVKPLSVVAIPKTMDNDVLWTWQSFGFMSAVDEAREVIAALRTEVTANPRVCVLQLFGSDSGFVVSHAVLASPTGSCDAALIPESDFTLVGLAKHLLGKVRSRIERGRLPYALVVMAETAVPVDAAQYLGDLERPAPLGIDSRAIGLAPAEMDAIREFDHRRAAGLRVEGQTPDELRSGALKLVKEGLALLLTEVAKEAGVPTFPKPRVLSNEPRQLLRSVRPGTDDVVMGQRLGTLAVDNAMAGYTDFMISQWLTEFVLVPLDLVVLGRKRIRTTGMFWKSVLAKTRQPQEMI